MFLSVSLDTKIKPKNIMTLKEFFKKLTSKIIWVNLLAMAVFIMLVAFGVWKGLEIYTHHGEEIEVPDVKGVQLGFAERMLSSRGLKAVVVDSSYNKALVGNSILEQTPQPGKTVKQGREIYLVINTVKTPTIAIPDLADNSSLREAEARLKALGFKLAAQEPDEGHPFGHGRLEYVSGLVVAMLIILRGDAQAQMLFLQFFGLFVPAPILLGGGLSLWLYRRYQRRRPILDNRRIERTVRQ